MNTAMPLSIVRKYIEEHSDYRDLLAECDRATRHLHGGRWRTADRMLRAITLTCTDGLDESDPLYQYLWGIEQERTPTAAEEP